VRGSNAITPYRVTRLWVDRLVRICDPLVAQPAHHATHDPIEDREHVGAAGHRVHHERKPTVVVVVEHAIGGDDVKMHVEPRSRDCQTARSSWLRRRWRVRGNVPRMFGLIVSGILLAGLFGWLIVMKRRQARSERAIASTPSPLPVVVDRPHDPTLCDFCDEKRSTECPVCTRPLCALHAPWRPGLFCALCNDEWEAGARRRALIVMPLVAVGMIAVAGVTVLVMEQTSMQPGLGALVLWVGSGAPMYLAIEHRMRRLFRRRGRLPRAHQVRR
jgi:hypothetical protein